jgi:hypothetical protein
MEHQPFPCQPMTTLDRLTLLHGQVEGALVTTGQGHIQDIHVQHKQI